jgi:hypothetical protein
MASDPDAPEATGQGASASSPIHGQATEASPLLPGSDAQKDAVPETPRIVLSRSRGLAVGLSLWVMILLQSKACPYLMRAHI